MLKWYFFFPDSSMQKEHENNILFVCLYLYQWKNSYWPCVCVYTGATVAHFRWPIHQNNILYDEKFLWFMNTQCYPNKFGIFFLLFFFRYFLLLFLYNILEFSLISVRLTPHEFCIHIIFFCFFLRFCISNLVKVLNRFDRLYI